MLPCQSGTSRSVPVPARTVSAQTILTGKKVVQNTTKRHTLLRKCRRLNTRIKVLKAENSKLKRQMKSVQQLLKANNINTLSVRTLHVLFYFDICFLFLKFQTMAQEGNSKALFLQHQLRNLKSKKPRWIDTTIRHCILWYAKSPSTYRLIRASGLLRLPSRSSLKRYLGACSGAVVTSLIKQRLKKEAGNHQCEQVNHISTM